MKVTKELIAEICEHLECAEEPSPAQGTVIHCTGGEAVMFIRDANFFCNIEELKEKPNYYFAVINKLTISGENFRTQNQPESGHISPNLILLADIHFAGCSFVVDSTLTIQPAKPISISFTKCHFYGKLKIRNAEEGGYENQQDNKAELEKLKFIDCTMGSADSKTTPFLRVGFLHVKKFILRNLRIPNDAEVNIGDCHFENFELSNIRNLGKFKLYKINILKREHIKKGNPLFQIDNASLGDADFQSINLDSFKKLKIFDNILSGVDYTNVIWADHIKNGIEVGQYTYIEQDSSDEEVVKKVDEVLKMEKERDTYRVLKNVALKNNDTPHALAFFAREMEFHSEIIRKNRSFWNQDRMILCFNRWSNNFGMSWWRPVWLILLAGAIFYALLLLSLTVCPCNSEVLGKFFVFLNPTHKTGFVGGCWGFLAYTIDFTFRIIEASLIYQAIQAFRRYARKF